jgi:hypothetical protein
MLKKSLNILNGYADNGKFLLKKHNKNVSLVFRNKNKTDSYLVNGEFTSVACYVLGIIKAYWLLNSDIVKLKK